MCCAFSVELKSLVVVLVFHLISAGLSKTVAVQKARNSNRWAVVGLLFGPLGLIAAVGMPDRHQIFYLGYWLSSRVTNPAMPLVSKKGEMDA